MKAGDNNTNTFILLTFHDRIGLISLPVLRYVVIQRIVGVGCGEKTLSRKESASVMNIVI